MNQSGFNVADKTKETYGPLGTTDETYFSSPELVANLRGSYTHLL